MVSRYFRRSISRISAQVTFSVRAKERKVVHTVIELLVLDDEVNVLISGKEIEILDASDDFVLAECSLADLEGIAVQSFPEKLQIEVRSENGFGTFFFHELHISKDSDGIALDFQCHTPNKYWEGRFGLATFIAFIEKQIRYFDNFKVLNIELDDDWKGITIRRHIDAGDPISDSIIHASDELKQIVKTAEIALAGIEWKEEYQTNEDIFCKEVLAPLLRRMGYTFVRYSHGNMEYGKDFTFSEITPFGNYRHYGLQAKAGNISGEVNSEADELLGQLNDAFSMPYYELGVKEPRYISTFIIAISGRFTKNAREKIVEKMPKGVIGSVYFWDRELIGELIEKYWSAK